MSFQSRRIIIALTLAFGISKVSAGEMASPLGTAPRPILPVFTNAGEMTTYCESGLKTVEAAIKAVADIPLEKAASIQTLQLWDALDIALSDLGGPVAITSATSPEKPVRDAAEACELKLSAVQTQLLQRADLYERLRLTEPTDSIDRNVKSVTLEGFEDAGVTLTADNRAKAKEIFDKLDALGVEFQRNTRENLATVSVTPAELEGMPKSYIDSHKPNDKGLVELKLNYPDYVPFMESAVSSDARRRYYLAFNQIGGQRNLDILQQASQLRKELAGIFGKPSFAHHIIARRMAGSPENVEKFLANVKDKVQAVEKRDLDVLRQAKAELLGRPIDEVRIERWDTEFYTAKVRREKYTIDQNALRKYFPTEASINWIFDLAQRMYGVRFVKADVPVWHADVRFYDVFDEKNKRIAGAYFDPFPRDGKYNHAAVWPVRGNSTLANRTPISVLVTNLDRTGLSHRELETLLHEFGHLLHGVLSTTRYNSLAGTSTRRDFVEAPSQMLEEWARSASSLALLKAQCKTCPVVDEKMAKRLNEAKRFAAGIHYSRQHVLASFDMAMASATPGDPQLTYRAIEATTPLGTLEGTMFPARFGHLLGGYAAGYYGYMWSEVLALDMASAWKGKLMDSKVSRRYLDKVLSRGGEVPANQMVRDFLGREPSAEPFFAEITGQSRDNKSSHPGAGK